MDGWVEIKFRKILRFLKKEVEYTKRIQCFTELLGI